MDFRNTVVILTSNIGCNFAGEAPTMGFLPGEAAKGVLMAHDVLRTKILGEVRKTLKPELLNRFDEIIVFHALDREAMAKILDVELAAVRKRLAAAGVQFELDAAATALILDEGFKPEQGARPLRRAIERLVEDALADAVLRDGPRKTPYLLSPAEPGPDGEKRLVATPRAPQQAAAPRKTPRQPPTRRRAAKAALPNSSATR